MDYDPDYLDQLAECTVFDWQSTGEDIFRDEDASGAVIADDWDQDEDVRLGLESRLAKLKMVISKIDSCTRTKKTDKKRLIIGGRIVEVLDTKGDTSLPVDELLSTKVVRDVEEFECEAFDQLVEEGVLDITDGRREALHALFTAKEEVAKFVADSGSRVTPHRNAGHMDDPASAYGRNLWADARIWILWTRLTTKIRDSCSLSLSFPSDVKGSWATVLPHSCVDGRHFVNMPKRAIPPVEIALAVVVPLASWPTSHKYWWTQNWHLESTPRLIQQSQVRVKWIHSSFKIVIPTQMMYS
jgi:hypothetical protein